MCRLDSTYGIGKALRLMGITWSQCWWFGDLSKRPVVLSLDQRQGSGDGGAVESLAANQCCEQIEWMGGCMRDRRQAGKSEHGLVELIRQRVHVLACSAGPGILQVHF